MKKIYFIFRKLRKIILLLILSLVLFPISSFSQTEEQKKEIDIDSSIKLYKLVNYVADKTGASLGYFHEQSSDSTVVAFKSKFKLPTLIFHVSNSDTSYIYKGTPESDQIYFKRFLFTKKGKQRFEFWTSKGKFGELPITQKDIEV